VEEGNPARQLAAADLNPPENVLALFLPGRESPPAEARELRARKFILVSVRPEFVNEYVEEQFFYALCRDLARLNGAWSGESLRRFQKLSATYYRGRDSFTHNLGVFHSTGRSLGMARLLRLGGGPEEADPPADDAESAPPAFGESISAWAGEYFARACCRILAHNVLLLNGRYFNVYFSAPLENEADIQALLEESRRYMLLVAAAAENENRRAAETGEIQEADGAP
jgi:hypothetical protein